jgi:hypothetical protein
MPEVFGLANPRKALARFSPVPALRLSSAHNVTKSNNEQAFLVFSSLRPPVRKVINMDGVVFPTRPSLARSQMRLVHAQQHKCKDCGPNVGPPSRLVRSQLGKLLVPRPHHGAEMPSSLAASPGPIWDIPTSTFRRKTTKPGEVSSCPSRLSVLASSRATHRLSKFGISVYF